MAPLGMLIAAALGITLFILVVIFVMVPVFKGLGYTIGWLFGAIAWLIRHIIEFVGGTIGDLLRFVGSIVAGIVLVPMTLLNVVLGRWSAAGHFADSVKREFRVGGACLYRAVLRRPLKLFWLHGILEGVEERLPEAMAAAPVGDKPHKKRLGLFDGYTIVGSLPGGGSGAKLYVAKPDKSDRPEDRVVIKTFALTDGSSLPQIVRESRALEAAKQLGLVLEHGMDENRFFYIMPYHAGDHLGIMTRQMHGESDGRGLKTRQLQVSMGYIADLLGTLASYHKGGLWHKDVKPENVIINNGRAHLVDLGLVTPLRSAMTLTTHGTEYFRDPELVRQALRGVKVHQVDGAKFDLYAVGAVLYFVLENTFPAHGALSKFHKKSPESLRWIVRRSMTDYDKRYESADAMLNDLIVLLNARDPFDVKPAQLPSMGGTARPNMAADMPPPIPEADPEPESKGVFAYMKAGLGENVKVYGVTVDQQGVHAGKFEVDDDGEVHVRPYPKKSGKRPNLRITDWWTGAYAVDDPGEHAGPEPAVAAASPVTHEVRREAQAFHQDAERIEKRFQAGAISARRAAKEQIKCARRRANEMRKRAHDHRNRSRKHVIARRDKSPSGFLAFIVLMAIVGGSVAGVTWLRAEREQRSISAHATVVETAKHRSPVLLVVDHEDPNDPRFSFELDAVAKRYSDKYEVFRPTDEANAIWRDLYNAWDEDRDGVADEMLEEAFYQHGLYGLVIARPTDSGVEDGLIFSEHPEAMLRHYAVVEAPTPDLPYLVINDHPVKHLPTVSDVIDERLQVYRDQGWDLTHDEDLEVEVRKLLPTGLSDTTDVPERLSKLLAFHDLGGIVIVTSGEGDGSAADRIVLRMMRR